MNDRTIYCYFHGQGIGVKLCKVHDHALQIHWTALGDRELFAATPNRILVNPKDQRILIAFDGHLIDGGMSKGSVRIAHWHWKTELRNRCHHPYVNGRMPPEPARLALKDLLIVPMERHLFLVLVRAGNFAFFRWDDKTMTRKVTFCEVRITNPFVANVLWHNTSP